MDLDSNIKLISSPEKQEFVFDGDMEEIDRYLQAFDEVQLAATGSPPSSSSSSDEQSKAKAAIQVAILRLVNEFRQLLKLNAAFATGKLTQRKSSATHSTTVLDSGSTNHEIHEEDYARSRSAITINDDVVQLLRLISVRMSSAGYLSDFLHVYVSERSTSIGASFRKLSVSGGNTVKNLNWEELESMIIDWIKAAKFCFSFLFPEEKRLIEQIFHDLGNSRVVESCFAETVRDSAIKLFDDADLLSMIRPSSRRIFRILDMYETLSGLLPQLSGLLGSDSYELLRTKAVDRILPKLAKLVRACLSRLEEYLLMEETPDSTSPTIIHSLTEYVMEYVTHLCSYKKTLMALPLSKPLEWVEFKGLSVLSFHVISILTNLELNLESQAKASESESLFFIMNNFYYIGRKIKENPALKGLLGDFCKFKLYEYEGAKDEYLRFSLKNVLDCLKDEGPTARFKHKLKAFNAEFDKVHKDLGNLVVPDFQLLVDLRKSLVEKLVPSYASFLGQCESIPGLEKHIKYSAESLEAEILNFFKGNP